MCILFDIHISNDHSTTLVSRYQCIARLLSHVSSRLGDQITTSGRVLEGTFDVAREDHIIQRLDRLAFLWEHHAHITNQ